MRAAPGVDTFAAMDPTRPSVATRTLGAILAGGASRRFGSPKALAEVGGRTIVARVRDALLRAGVDVVLVTGEPERFAELGVPARADAVAGLGALGGIRTALEWAREEGRAGALCVACDLPFVSAAVLGMLLERAGASGVDAVAPESGGRRGVEPLCAWYSVACLGRIDELAARGELMAAGLLDRVRTVRVPLHQVARAGDPAVLFFNVNTPADHARARQLAADGADAPSA